MKKRILTLLLCAVLLFASLPVLPVSLGGIVASAALDTAALQALVDQVPADRSQWNLLYLESSTVGLATAYDNARAVLDNPNNYTQRDVASAQANLQAAINLLQYHTTGIAVNPRSATAGVGSTLTLTATKEPANAADPVNWVSGNPAVAEVNSNGRVTVKKYSETPVLISAISNGTASSCSLTVTNPLGGVRLSQSSASLFSGKQLQLTATPVGKDDEADVTDRIDTTLWTSDNTSVATVSDSGLVRAVGTGAATITASMTSAGVQFTADCIVTVGRTVEITAIKPVTVAVGGTMTTSVGATETVTVTIEPSNASDKELTWTSSDTSVATIGESTVSGADVSVKIKTLQEGTARITYTANDGSGMTGFFTLNVNPSVSFIQVTPEKLVITPSMKDQKVTATVLPADAGNQVVTWKSSNPNVCDVNYAGLLSPKMYGVCTITATTTDGSGLSGSCTVRVADPAASVSVDKATLSLKVGDTAVLKGTVRTTTGETYNDVEWISSNAAVATVDADGKVEALTPGTATILAVTLDGTEKNAVCAVSVTADLERIELPERVEVDLNGTLTLSPDFVPSNASNKTVTWASADKTIATVSSKGVVTGKKAGTTTVTCTAANGVKATCTVRVIIPVESISLSDSKLSISAGATQRIAATITPMNASDVSVQWTSSDPGVATVSDIGEVTGVAGGKCTITATAVSGGKFAACTVTVVEGVSGIRFEHATETMYETQSLTLTPEITPATATNQALAWTSSDPAIANVSSAGIVTARAAGTAVITATTVDGGFSDSVTVTVTKMVSVTGIYISYNNIALMAGNTYTIGATVYPSNASNKNILWSSNDTSVAAVFNGGEVSANGPGTCVITATTVDGGYSYRCNVTVTQAATGVKLSNTKLNVPVGSSKTLVATLVPANATNKNVTWYSADQTIATVSSRGIVTGKKVGVTTVTVMTEDGDFSASCTVNVYTPATGIKINSEKITLAKGSKTVLTATITPADTTNQTVKWSSSDASIASISSAGQVAGLKVGSVTITATTSDGKQKAYCIVDVVQAATAVTLDYTTLQLDVGKNKTLSASLKPLTVTNKSVKWSSSDKTIATINSKGTITALKAGTVTIKCVSADGAAKATCKVTVIQRVSSIKFVNANDTVKVGAKKFLTVTTLPKDASETTFIWKSSNKKIAKVNSKGKVLGVAPGTCTITVSNSAGTVKAKCTLTVTTGVESISLDKAALSISKGRSTTLKATITPKNATDQGVTWTSSNNDVATVNSKGKITAKAIGYAVITATTNDAGAKATCKVQVVYGVKSVALDQTKLTMNVGTKQTLKAAITPSYASNQNITWKSSNKNIARVTTAGVVKAVRPGTANITVTTADGGFTATCKVTVVVPATGVALSRQKLTLEKSKIFNLKATVSPADATNQKVKWISGNKNVVTVDANGKVKAVGAGTAIVTAKTYDGGFKATCKITVKVLPTEVKLSKTKLTLGLNSTAALNAAVLPSEAEQTVTWSTSDAKVVAVNQSGLVRGRKIGTATVTATTSNGKSASCVISVRQVLTELTFNRNALTLQPEQTGTLKATALPTNASDAALIWRSSNTKVAAVNAKGVVTAIAVGTAKITVSNAASGLSDTCIVTVRRPVTGVSLDKKTLSLSYRETATLKATVAPRNATNQTILWQSTDTKVAKVTKHGLVTAVGAGKATISAVTDDGAFTASCVVKVTVPVTGITLKVPEKPINVGSTLTLSAATVPAFASNPAVTFATSDPTIATVSAKGVVTGVKAGVAAITATTVEGGYKQTVNVTVTEPVTEIRFTASTYLMAPGGLQTLTPLLLPESAPDKSLTWSSGNGSVATVDATGRVKAIAPGETTITATATGSGASNSVTVRVIEVQNQPTQTTV